MGGKHISAQVKAEIHQKLLTTKELAEKHGYTVEQIRNCAYREGVRLPRRGPRVNEDFFRIKNDDFFYVLGWIASDGCIQTRRGSVTLTVKSTDVDIIRNIADMIGYENRVYLTSQFDARTNKTYERVTIAFTSRVAVDVLAGYNMGDRKSLTLTYPPLINEEQHRHFFRGFYDGDGSISQSGGTNCVAFCGPYLLMTEMSRLLHEILDVQFAPVQLVNELNSFSILKSRSNKVCLKFLEWIYKDTKATQRLQRKYNRYLEYFG